MKFKFARAAAATAIAAAALFAVPQAAQAYTPPPRGVVNLTIVNNGGTVVFNVTGGAFVIGENVNISVSGEGATGASFALLKFAPSTQALGTVRANSAGGVDPVTIRFPASAVGTHVITATSASNPAGVSTSVTVSAAGTAAGGSSGSGSTGLAVTGFNSNDMLGLWVGGGALVLAGGGVVAASAVRRNRKLAASN